MRERCALTERSLLTACGLPVVVVLNKVVKKKKINPTPRRILYGRKDDKIVVLSPSCAISLIGVR